MTRIFAGAARLFVTRRSGFFEFCVTNAFFRAGVNIRLHKVKRPSVT